ncbi:cell cycle protein MesJ [Legionella quinlivanii]|uniref:tRNA(Ile)-lysidine synthase n=1 Tax=Legionella quinlivanii TaxID=45073 RepID=A0A0W0Y468_9GAMM|nr:tRNA lysidine(34) synthetase TilS [Legionella quinlivanii]KTD51803.1 cell cycle protein MesJ [Legionella quinlivanii]MCW8451140.1 tRNA lysidine(34) synthetase TilS [Legionella quinlivanii]SEF66867.1 tRNA(Ile)-lysidine synthase [Legionella quinlivanii DSM 21216]STY10670.1 cell cycle protein MesJ [Legionella quinlivanii]
MISLDFDCISSLLEPFDKLYAGFSGGLDSTVLLYALAKKPQLKAKLTAVHVHHGLSPNADSWKLHCEQFCLRHDIPLIVYHVQLNTSSNIEKAAREKRYELFSSLSGSNTCILLGHHRDDQAETLLLQLFRGAGIEGLSAMPAWRSLGKGLLFRPLLDYTRAQIELYAINHKLSWVDDESNQETHFSRNYLRHSILPLIRVRWPGVEDNLIRTATHCQQAQHLLDQLALSDCPKLHEPSLVLDCADLLDLDNDRLNNIIRYWLRQNQVLMPDALTFNRIIPELLLSREDATPLVSWGECVLRRYRKALHLMINKPTIKLSALLWGNFPEPLVIDSISIAAKSFNTGVRVLPGDVIEIRFRQGGERMKIHGHSKMLKKLFQEWGVPQWQRDRVPLLYINQELAMVVGYAISDSFFQNDLPFTFKIEGRVI